MPNLKHNLSGKQFGRWTALVYVGGIRSCWDCVCECGERSSVPGYMLRKGTSAQCKRCASRFRFAKARQLLIGSKFGKWTILSIDGRHSQCLCDCGREYRVFTSSLRYGTSTKCKPCGTSPRLPGNESAFRQVVNGYRVSANSRKLVWELTNEQAHHLMTSPCFYCGKLPNDEPIAARVTRYGSKIAFVYNGIDRQDNNHGYASWNCVTCCMICNLAKRNMKLSDFVAWIERLRGHSLQDNPVPRIQEAVN